MYLAILFRSPALHARSLWCLLLEPCCLCGFWIPGFSGVRSGVWRGPGRMLSGYCGKIRSHVCLSKKGSGRGVRPLLTRWDCGKNFASSFTTAALKSTTTWSRTPSGRLPSERKTGSPSEPKGLARTPPSCSRSSRNAAALASIPRITSPPL